MAQVKIKGTIKFKLKKNHPDLQYVKPEERDKEQIFDDVYYIETDNFFGEDHIESYIKNDLKLVAGGGYDTDTIEDVKIKLERVY